MTLDAALSVATGLAGVVIGALLSEFIRRRQRAENLAGQIFSKQLATYSELWSLVSAGDQEISEMMSRDDLSHSQRHEVVSGVVLRIAHFVDANQFYLDEDLAPHCIALFMGAENVGGLGSPQKTKSIENYRAKVRETRRMIFEDAGVTQITKALKDINKPNLHSPVISVLRQARNDLKNKK